MNIGDRVNIKVGPTLVPHTGTIEAKEGQFLHVKCDDGKTRKVRPGSAKPA